MTALCFSRQVLWRGGGVLSKQSGVEPPHSKFAPLFVFYCTQLPNYQTEGDILDED